MKFLKVDIDELIPAEYNPRKDLKPSDSEYQKIKKSIEEFGYVEPIIVNSDNTIIGGHQRLKVLKDLGYKEIDVVRIDIDKTKEKALNIALNKITGDWEQDKLAELLDDLIFENFDINITGFEDFDLEDFGVGFELPSGDKGNLEQITFTLTNEQAEVVRGALKLVNKFNYDTYGNENSNGNKLHEVVNEWLKTR